MKTRHVLNELLCLLTIPALLFFGCRKQEPAAAPATQSEPQEPQTEAEETPPEVEEKSFMSQMTPVENIFKATGIKKNHPRYTIAIEKDASCFVVDEDADVVFPKSIGGFSLSFFGMPDIGWFDTSKQEKRPICICYDSEELNSSACILLELNPCDASGVQMDLASCQNRMQEMIKQVATGKVPMALYDQVNEEKALSANGNNRSLGIIGLQIDEPSQEDKLEDSAQPFRSLSWSWRIPNGRSTSFIVNEKGLHGAEMFWSMTRDAMHGVDGYSKPGNPIGNLTGELQYALSSLIVQKGECLITVIVQSEGKEADENHPIAVEVFQESFDKDVLSSSCRVFYDRQDEKYEKSAWSTFSKEPLPVHAAFKKDVPQSLLASCLSKEEMEGKPFGEICGVDYDTKLNYSKCDEQSRLADALQNLILYIKDYSTRIPSESRKPLDIVFKGTKGHIDADVLIGVFGSNPTLTAEQTEVLPATEKILREKIMLRARQVQRITRIIANNKQRQRNALEREIDPKRTAMLEAYMRELQSNEYHQKLGRTSNDVRNQIKEAVNHILDELKSGKVSTCLNATPQNMNYNSMGSIVNALQNIGGRYGIPLSSYQADLAKTFFDLGNDLFASALLGMGDNILQDYKGSLLPYMLANGLDLTAVHGGSVQINNQEMWKSPRLTHLMVLSNYPISGWILGNLIIEGKSDILRELLLADAPVNERINDQLPLAIAIQRGNTELEQLLLANGADKELTDRNGKKPEDYRIYGIYWNALNSKDYKTQQECLAKGMDVNQSFSNQKRYIDVAFENKDIMAFRLLLDAGADYVNNNLLVRACQTGQLEIFRMLLERGAPLEQNRQHILCSIFQPYYPQKDSLVFLKEILARMDKEKLNEEICDLNGQGMKMTPACFAIFVGNSGNETGSTLLLQKLKLLEEAGADIAKMPTTQSLSPLFYAVLKNHSTIDIYSYLLSKGLDVNSVTVPKSLNFFNNEWTLGNEIALKGVEKTGLLTYMTRQYAKTGYTNQNFLKNVLPYLVEKGAKADIKDTYGKTSFDYLEEIRAKNAYNAQILQSSFEALGLM